MIPSTRRASTSALLLSLALLPLALPARGDDELATRQVLAAEKARYDAMVAGDLVALGELLADDLVYTHTHGAAEGRTAFLESLRSGALRYRKIESAGSIVRLYGEAAVVTGTAVLHVTAGGSDVTVPIRFTAVYARDKEGAWRLTTWQSTRRAEPAK